MIQIALDFAPGLHGHFLELVLNKYIYGVDYTVANIFQSTGAVHVINVDSEYQKSKIVGQGHFSSLNYSFVQGTKKVVFINHCPELDFVLLTNIYYRCHSDAVNKADFNIDIIKSMHEKNLAERNDLDLRNNWYSKLNQRLFVEHSSMKPRTALPVYDFDYKSFFNLNNFCAELQKTARFLEETFKFDTSLANLWHEFMERNQGWALYQQAESILVSTVSKQPMTIPDDWKTHAYLNFRLSQMFDIYDGVLYTSEKYPSTTLELLEVVQKHIANFDNRW